MRATIYPGPDGWRWNVQGLNNEILCQGEAYVRREDAEHVLHVLFGTRQMIEVSVRDHGDKIIGHYTVGTAAVRGRPARATVSPEQQAARYLQNKAENDRMTAEDMASDVSDEP